MSSNRINASATVNLFVAIMSTENQHQNLPAPDPGKGLPPVTPPTGRHIVQLFLVPGLIVAGAVTILLGFSWLAGGSRTPEQFLKNLDSANNEIRWRAANDLAQVLKRDDKLAADVGFGLRLAERLHKAAAELDRLERARAELPKTAAANEIADANKALIAQRNYVVYLGACLGNLSVPVGAPMLVDLARNGRGKDDKVRVMVRRQAVLALANLGAGQQRYQKLRDEQKAAVQTALESESESANPLTKAWAEAALAWLTEKKSLGVIPALADCARDERDVFLREQVAHALNFWDGAGAEQNLAERTLLLLARDTGRGERIEIVDEEDKDKRKGRN